jgi:hypothetical protein
MGRRIVESLVRAAVPVTLSSWIYFPELSEWHFFIATPLVDTKGPRNAYDQVLKVMTRENISPEFPLHRVFLIGADHPIVEKVRENLKTSENQIQQFVNVQLANGFAREAYVYIGGSIRITAHQNETYHVMFFPYSGPGGAVPAKRMQSLEEVREFLQAKVRVTEEIVIGAFETLQKRKSVTIPNIQLSRNELKRLGLAA